MGLLDQLLGPFITVLTGGMGTLPDEVDFLMRVFIGIEIVTSAALWFFAHEQVVTLLSFKTVRIGLFALFVTQWPVITTLFLDTMIWTGAQTSRGALTVETFKSPSTLFAVAFTATKPLFEWMNKVGSTWRGFATNVVNILLFAIAALIVWASFMLMALHVMIAQVMFYLGTAFLLIFIPFGVFSGTSFLAERAIGSVISSSVRLGMMAATIGVAFPLISTWAMPNPETGIDPSMRQAFTFAGAAVGVFCLTWVIPSWAASLFEGGAILTGQSLVTGVSRPAMNLVTGGADLAVQGTSSLLKKVA